MSEKFSELREGFFSREDFHNVISEVFASDLYGYIHCITTVADSQYRMIQNFSIFRDDEDRWYFIYLPSGVMIDWFKLMHFGRDNRCNRSDFTVEDLKEFFVMLKIQLDLYFRYEMDEY